ncbi:MAG TPA: nuclear transport factor 2 family protein [Candidatus Baltobacteraceae bacterium]|nr:nuclear transport factor 2 family protein [Candidatus Baltobacteraceae bacterium]
MNDSFGLPEPIAAYVGGMNRGSIDEMAGGFAPDAWVNDEHTEHIGGGAIRAWLSGAIKAQVRIAVRNVRSNGRAQVIVDGEIDGSFPRDGLPERIVLTHYFSLENGKISQLIILLNDVHR